MKQDLLSHKSPTEFEYKGLKCIIRRLGAGCWAGFVVPPPDSKTAKGEYGDAFKSIHGSENIEHLGKEGEIGFDTMQDEDLTAFELSCWNCDESAKNKHFWTFDETKAETEKLADLVLELG